MLTLEPDRVELKPGSKVLDLGCGDGRHIRWTRMLPGVTSIGLDLGEEEVAGTFESLKKMDSVGPEAGGASREAGPWAVVRASAYQLPFADNTFDCVIISEVLEHLHEDDVAIDELHRVLKDDATLVVSVPREGPEAVCWALSSEYRNSPGGHVRIFRRSALKKKLEDHGFEVWGMHFAHALHSPYWWLKCAVGMNNDDFWPVKLYHKLLVWDLMERPWMTRLTEKILNPFIGKSVVFYATKG